MNTTPSQAPTTIVLDDYQANMTSPQLASIGKLNWLFGGKPLVNHVIEELAQLGVDNCFVLTNSNARQLYANIVRVYHWNTRMNIETLNYELDKEAVLRDFDTLANPNGLLIVESHTLRSRVIEQFLQQAQQNDGHCLTAYSNGVDLGLTLLKAGASKDVTPTKIELQTCTSLSMETCHDFSQANFKLLSGELCGLLPRIAPAKNKPLWQHNRSSLHRSTALHNHVFIERGSRVDRACRLNNVMINENAYIGKGCDLDNVIVMPNAYVPAQQTIQNAIVCEDQIVSLHA